MIHWKRWTRHLAVIYMSPRLVKDKILSYPVIQLTYLLFGRVQLCRCYQFYRGTESAKMFAADFKIDRWHATVIVGSQFLMKCQRNRNILWKYYNESIKTMIDWQIWYKLNRQMWWNPVLKWIRTLKIVKTRLLSLITHYLMR